MTTTATLSPSDLEALNARFDAQSPQEIIRWAAETFSGSAESGGLVMTSSFGADALCTIHLATQIKPDIPIIVVNTGYLFSETLMFMEQMRARFALNIREYHTKNDPIVWLSVNGEPDPRTRNNVEACCAANKNEVFDRAMRQLAPAAWLRGVRADQSDDRRKMKILQFSQRHNCWALSPILRWSARDVFQYMKQHGLPHHPLWEKGYTSIGCNPLTCTRAITATDDPRAGRWSGTEKTECGIHLDQGAGI